MSYVEVYKLSSGLSAENLIKLVASGPDPGEYIAWKYKISG